MKTKYSVICFLLLCSVSVFSQTNNSSFKPDSTSTTLQTRIEKLIAPIPLKVLFWIDSVPSNYNMLNNVSFVKEFPCFKENDQGNNRLGYIKSESSNVNIFFYAKISSYVNVYTIKADMNFLDFSNLGEIPNESLNPKKILTLRKLSEDIKNEIRFDEVIFYITNEHFKFQNNKWEKVVE